MTRKTFNDDQRAFLVHLLTHQEIKDFFFGKLDLEEVLDEEAIHEGIRRLRRWICEE